MKHFLMSALHLIYWSRALSKRGNLGSVPAPVAGGFNGPHNTLLPTLGRNYANQKR